MPENHLFAIQDGTQLIRVLSIIFSRKETANDYLLVANTSRAQDSAFFDALMNIASVHQWAGKAILTELPIPDSLEYYLPHRDAIAQQMKIVVEKDMGLVKCDAVYVCRNWQWGADCLLHAFGGDARRVAFGDGFGCLDVREDTRYIQMDAFLATLPIQHSVDRGYRVVALDKLPLEIVGREHCVSVLEKFPQMHPMLCEKLRRAFQGDQVLLINTTGLTETGVVAHISEEIQYYLSKLANLTEIIRSHDITKIVIKAHPRESQGQSRLLAAALKDVQLPVPVVNLTDMDTACGCYPVEILGQAIPVKHVVPMSLSYSILGMSSFYGTSYSKPSLWDMRIGLPASWETYVRSFLDLTSSLLALPSWDGRNFLNPRLTHRPIFEGAKDFDRANIPEKIKELLNYYRDCGIGVIADILESALEEPAAKESGFTEISQTAVKLKHDPSHWKRAGQPSEFLVHKDDPYRQSDKFRQDSEAIFRFLGFTGQEYAGRIVVDIGAGSRLRANFFEGAELVVVEPLAERFIREIQWCDLPTASKVYSEPTEKRISELEGVADLVVSINVLDHCYDFEAIAGNIASYLKAGGVAALSFDKHLFTDEQHPLILTKEICVETFKNLGLELTAYSEGIKGLLSCYGHGPCCMNFILKKLDNHLAAKNQETSVVREDDFDITLAAAGGEGMSIQLSICIPTYNRLPFLKELVASIHANVENQRYPVEVVISETASDDGTNAYIREIAAELSQWVAVRVISRAEKVDWMDHMFEMPHFAKGEYVWIIGDDDILFDNGMAAVLQNLESLGCDVLLVNKLVANKDLSEAILQKQHDIAGPFLTSSLADLCGRFGLMTEVGFTSALIYKREPVLGLTTDEWFRTRSIYAQTIRLLEPFSKSLCAAIDDVVVVHRQGNQRSDQTDIAFDEVILRIPRCLVLLLQKGAVVPDQISAMLEESAPGDGEYVSLLARLERIAALFPGKFYEIGRHVLFQGWVELNQRLCTPYSQRILNRLIGMFPPVNQEASFPCLVNRNVLGFDIFEYQGWYHAISSQAGPVNLESAAFDFLGNLANEGLYFSHPLEERLLAILRHNTPSSKL